jgi:hypothetical protein
MIYEKPMTTMPVLNQKIYKMMSIHENTWRNTQNQVQDLNYGNFYNTEKGRDKHILRVIAVDDLTDALIKCEKRFTEYEKIHTAKGDHEKANRNKEIATMCRETLTKAGVEL